MTHMMLPVHLRMKHTVTTGMAMAVLQSSLHDSTTIGVHMFQCV